MTLLIDLSFHNEMAGQNYFAKYLDDGLLERVDIYCKPEQSEANRAAGP